MKRLYGYCLFAVAMSFLSASQMSIARSRDREGEIEVGSRRKFEKLTDQYRYVVAMFYYRDKEMRSKGTLSEEIEELKRMFRAVSREQRYENAQVAFLRINLAWKHAHEIAQAFQITADKIPSFILIKNGDAVRDTKGDPFMLTGYASRDALIGFIDTHWRDQLVDEAKRLAEVRERREQDSRVYWYYDPWPRSGWGWPWCGRPYYWW